MALMRVLGRTYTRDDKGRFGHGSGTAADLTTAAGAKAFEFTDEVTGLSVEVHQIRNPGLESGQSTYIALYIKDRQGEIVGIAEHTVLSGDPPTRARLDGLALEVASSSGQALQGQGFAARYMAQVEQTYREHGVTTLSLTANIDVGGYAWARDGYDFTSHSDRATVAGRAKDVGRKFSAETQAQIRAVADNPHSSAIEFAMIGWQAGASTWPGKQIMLGSMWGGTKQL